MKCYFPSIMFNFIIIVFLFQCSRSLNLTHQYCKEAAKRDPNFSNDFCVACLEANPDSQNASLEELVVISLKLTQSNATNISSYISQLLNEQKFNSYTIGALQDCLELYSDANSTLYDAMHHFMSQDYFKAKLDVSAAMDSSGTCEDGFKEKKGVVSPLTEHNKIFFELTAIILAFISMLS